MTDIVSVKTRSRMMAGIGSKNTWPELLVRQLLHRLGFRYRLHYRKLPGKPDLAFPKYHAVILVNGCFWHGHSCNLFKWPITRKVFWHNKIRDNQKRDERNLHIYRSLGWRTLVVWECAIKGVDRIPDEQLAAKMESWLKYGNEDLYLPDIKWTR